MWWWIKARRAHSILFAGFLVTLTMGLTLGGTVVELPSLVSVGYPAILSMFAPIPVVSALAMSLDSRIASAEASGIREVRFLDGTLIFATVLGILGVGLLASSETIAAVGRNTAFLVGLLLVARPFGQLAVMAPVAWIMLVVFISRPPPNPSLWSILPEEAAAPHAAAAAAAMFVSGTSVLLFPREYR
ncbi:hypothetical protein ACFYYN_18390 [Streptomyces sp. NPDC001902]